MSDRKNDLPVEEHGAYDFRDLKLKPDHHVRPIYVTPDGHLFLETFSPIYKQAYDFLIAIAEPLTRPKYVHEYQLTINSLYAAVSIGLKTTDILEHLNRLCKTNIPPEITKFIEESTATHGKVRLLLKSSKYYIESGDPTALHTLLQNPIISDARVKSTEGLSEAAAPSGRDLSIAGTSKKETDDAREEEILIAAAVAAEQDVSIPADLHEYLALVDGDEDASASRVVSFEIPKERVQEVQKQCLLLEYPLLSEYDFRNDTSIPNMKIELKPMCVLRAYQEKSLRKMFGNGRARSGIIVLPCGAGKTLTGVTACCTMKKRAIVVCTSGVAVEQWRSEFLRWCDIERERVCCFTSDHRGVPASNSVVICTYSMLSRGETGRRAADTARVFDYLRSQEWGLMILDEVQTVPAETFQKVLTSIPSHCKLGLTATLVREDGKIDDLRFLIGPKLYEANWMDLQAAGYIANVSCSEVWCPMTPAFYREYLCEDYSMHLRRKIYVCNPIKWQTCEALVRKHEALGDKIIIFSDDVFALRTLAQKLQRAFLDGSTPQATRIQILQLFKTKDDFRTIMCSKIADNAFDLPDANVLIQVSSHGASRMQEAQRLGRILRAKKASRKSLSGEPNAFFYSLVSRDTKEMAFAAGRQRFLTDQGYAYKVVEKLDELSSARPASAAPICSSAGEQQELLCQVLTYRSRMDDEEDVPVDVPATPLTANSPAVTPASTAARKRTAAIADLTGAGDMVYGEVRRPVKPRIGKK